MHPQSQSWCCWSQTFTYFAQAQMVKKGLLTHNWFSFFHVYCNSFRLRRERVGRAVDVDEEMSLADDLALLSAEDQATGQRTSVWQTVYPLAPNKSDARGGGMLQVSFQSTSNGSSIQQIMRMRWGTLTGKKEVWLVCWHISHVVAGSHDCVAIDGVRRLLLVVGLTCDVYLLIQPHVVAGSVCFQSCGERLVRAKVAFDGGIVNSMLFDWFGIVLHMFIVAMPTGSTNDGYEIS
jgi:hypothetical protein